MFFGCLAVLIASANFLTEAPLAIRDKLLATNETSGSFIQTKHLATGETFQSRGTYEIRPGRDFKWIYREPFDAAFIATQKNYTYTNEDECVVRPLSELKGFSDFIAIEKGDFSMFFKAFNALYREEENGVFHVLAKPKDSQLQKFLSRVEADGTLTNWTLRATFPDKTILEIQFRDDNRDK